MLARITSKGQVTIPKEIRQALQLNKGDRINFALNKNNEVVLQSMSKDIDSLVGIIKTSKKATVEEMNASIRKQLKGKS